MTVKQQVIKLIYPVFKLLANRKNRGSGVKANVNGTGPGISFYNLSAKLSSGANFSFSELKGKKVLVVNVASDCGYTPQYEELEKLNKLYKDKLVIMAFPANDFREQEPQNDQQIETFCKVNYGVSFPLFKKASVVGHTQQQVFQWLSQKNKNGWNEQPPTWNFCKYLVDGNGKLQYFFAPYISPMGKEMTQAIHSI